MDQGDGTFKPMASKQEALAAAEKLGRPREQAGVFKVGDKVDIAGSRFVIQRLTKRTMVLFLLPRTQQLEARLQMMQQQMQAKQQAAGQGQVEGV